ncbi:unnamed protein product [Effrenium voratum]|nr:unnamed protein product [Effrenium voratum]
MPSRDSFRDARAMEIEKRRVADLVAAALPQGEVPEEEEEVPLRELGLDSVSATFLQGQLSELFGRPFGDLGATTLAQLAALLRSEAEAPKGGCRLSARRAEPEDWPEVQDIWREHHHLVEMVGHLSRLALLGPPAWLAAALFAVAGVGGEWAAWGELCLKASLGYFALALLQHPLHWLLARAILGYDLRWGELTFEAAERRFATFVCERDGDGERDGERMLQGVLCVREDPPPRAAPRGASASASLWHAAVRPAARNRGAALALLRAAEGWAQGRGLKRVEAVCLNAAAKAACWNMGLELTNPRFGRLPMLPAFFAREIPSGSLVVQQVGIAAGLEPEPAEAAAEAARRAYRSARDLSLQLYRLSAGQDLLGLCQAWPGPGPPKPRDVYKRGGLKKVYTSVAALCGLTLAVRILTARLCGLPFNRRHGVFLLMLLVLFVGRVASDIWELGGSAACCGHQRAPTLVAAGRSRWMYNLLSTGPVVIFLTIFLVLLYHLTCVLHSISVARENLEAAYCRSLALTGSLDRSSFHAVRRRCKPSLQCFRCFMIATALCLWVFFFIGYAAALACEVAATLVVQDWPAPSII